MMEMPMSAEELLSIVRHYWPSTEECYLTGEASPELERLQALWQQELKKLDKWWALLDELEEELPGFIIGDGTATVNPSFRCVAYSGRRAPHRFAVVGCLSILAPLFTVYGLEFEETEETRRVSRVCFEPLPAEMQEPARVMARKIEAAFGASALPREVAETPIPLFVEWMAPPNTTLFHALFASRPEIIP
jgi:hypothetical protein